MTQYMIETTDEQDKVIQAFCDAQPIPEKGSPVTPADLINPALFNAVVDCADRCKFGLSSTVADRYNKADDAKRAQVEAILGVK